MDPAGSRANKTGNRLEKFIEHTIEDNGYKFIDKKRFGAACCLDQCLYTKQYKICRSIYDSDLICDYILYHPEKHPKKLVIESKWQQSSGTAQEKLVYTVVNIKKKSPYKTIIVIDGRGFTEGAKNWLKNQVNGNLNQVFNMSDFHEWANDGGL